VTENYYPGPHKISQCTMVQYSQTTTAN